MLQVGLRAQSKDFQPPVTTPFRLQGTDLLTQWAIYAVPRQHLWHRFAVEN